MYNMYLEKCLMVLVERVARNCIHSFYLFANDIAWPYQQLTPTIWQKIYIQSHVNIHVYYDPVNVLITISFIILIMVYCVVPNSGTVLKLYFVILGHTQIFCRQVLYALANFEVNISPLSAQCIYDNVRTSCIKGSGRPLCMYDKAAARSCMTHVINLEGGFGILCLQTGTFILLYITYTLQWTIRTNLPNICGYHIFALQARYIKISIQIGKVCERYWLCTTPIPITTAGKTVISLTYGPYSILSVSDWFQRSNGHKVSCIEI